MEVIVILFLINIVIFQAIYIGDLKNARRPK